jgi:hypothetical protein
VLCSVSKSKAVPLHAIEALGGGEEYISYLFTTFALDGGEWSVSRLGCTLLPGKDPQYPLDRRLGGPKNWFGHRLEENSFASGGD